MDTGLGEQCESFVLAPGRLLWPTCGVREANQHSERSHFSEPVPGRAMVIKRLTCVYGCVGVPLLAK